MGTPSGNVAEKVELDYVRDVFFRLLEADRESEDFLALYEECHRLIGMAMDGDVAR